MANDLKDMFWAKFLNRIEEKQNGIDIVHGKYRSSEPETPSSVDSNKSFGLEGLDELDKFGSTPPRTRLLRRERERSQRGRGGCVPQFDRRKFQGCPFSRRKTSDSLDAALEMQGSPDQNDLQSRRAEKRSMKLLRGNERDLKLDIGIKAPVAPMKLDLYEDRANSMPTMSTPFSVCSFQSKIPPLIETCNRFMSLSSSTPVTNRVLNKENLQSKSIAEAEPPTPVVNAWLNQGCQPDRVEFYKKINKMVKMGSTVNKLQRQESTVNQDNQVWQTELQDLIWLELQAYHADRTPTEQDNYLCQERKKVGQLLEDLISYKFQPIRDVNSRYYVPSEPSSASSTTCSNDSGFETGPLHPRRFSSTPKEDCSGCFTVYCESCLDHQRKALQEVDSLMNKFETAFSLFPSTRAFAIHYPIITTVEFTSKLKALCLWYNFMKHLRLKLFLMGKFLIHLRSKYGTGIKKSSSSLTIDEEIERKTAVRFDCDAMNPTDSNDSYTAVGNCGAGDPLPEDFWDTTEYEYLEVAPSKSMEDQFIFGEESSPFRLFVEDVIKTSGLKGALLFFDSMYRTVLRKAQFTLTKPDKGMVFEEYCQKYCQCNKEKEEEQSETPESENPIPQITDECELRRYGYFCPQTQEMQLPSYKSLFLFMSLVPIRILQIFMRMKLERNPAKPSPLSIRQLMKELKEGMAVCATHRLRICDEIRTLEPVDEDWIRYKSIVDIFDESFKGVFEIYMDYLEQWSLMIQNESFQKNAIEDEWAFAKSIIPAFPIIKKFVGDKFTCIVGSMLKCSIVSLNSRIEELENSIHTGISGDDDPQKRHCMWFVFRKLQRILNEERERTMKAISFTKTLRKDLRAPEFSTDEEMIRIVNDTLAKLRYEIISLRKMINNLISRLEEICDIPDRTTDLDDAERCNLRGKCFDMLQHAFRFGYEIFMQHHIDTTSLKKELRASTMAPPTIDQKAKEYIARSIIQFAKLWIQFIVRRVEHVRKQPTNSRWLQCYLEFLNVAGDPHYTKFLTNEEFVEFQNEIQASWEQIISWKNAPKPTVPQTPGRIRRVKNSSSSPQPITPSSAHSSISSPPLFKGRSSLTKAINKDNVDKFITPEVEDEVCDSPESSMKDVKSYFDSKLKPRSNLKPARIDRIRDSVNRLESQLDDKLRSNELIGQVTATHAIDRVHIKSRVVTFSWQRGIKIGQGRFGKVYTAVNNQSGEMLAMKEISLQPNDHKMIKRVAEEIKTFEGLTHENLVRYYGVEIHREEMLIFMEFCAEGTLESLVAATDGGLPELLIRQYTRQLLSAVDLLHNHGVVHRDIKSANIFLTNEGKCIKLGDFGSAVKIKAHTTMPGELQAFVGTQAYMAPEVFMKTNTEGHGRAADIWSIGCVVIEMGSGKRPWAQYDSNYQIMFVVGMGETPEIPDRLSDEAHDFLECCLQHNPKDRLNTKDLQNHNFAKVDESYLE